MQIVVTGFEFEDQDFVTVTVDILTPALISYDLTFDPDDFFDMSVSEMQDKIAKAVLKILAAEDQLKQIVDKKFSIDTGTELKKAYA